MGLGSGGSRGGRENREGGCMGLVDAKVWLLWMIGGVFSVCYCSLSWSRVEDCNKIDLS